MKTFNKDEEDIEVKKNNEMGLMLDSNTNHRKKDYSLLSETFNQQFLSL